MKTGWPPGLLQDDDRKLSKWFASRPDARYQLRKNMKEEIIKMALAAEFHVSGQRVLSPVIEGSDLLWLLERFAAIVRADERNKLAQWMIDRSYATGHGDTVEDLLGELEWQVREAEREACARIAEEWQGPTKDREIHIAQAIRARGQE